MYSEVPLDPRDAPPLDDLRAVFAATHAAFIAALSGAVDADLARADPAWPDGTLLGGVVNLIMHEGEHLAGIDALAWWFRRHAG